MKEKNTFDVPHVPPVPAAAVKSNLEAVMEKAHEEISQAFGVSAGILCDTDRKPSDAEVVAADVQKLLDHLQAVMKRMSNKLEPICGPEIEKSKGQERVELRSPYFSGLQFNLSESLATLDQMNDLLSRLAI